MRQFQLEEYTQDINATLPDDIRLLSDDDIAWYIHIYVFKKQQTRKRKN